MLSTVNPGGITFVQACSNIVHAQAFSAWIHICAIRLFVESILRYGLPPKFVATLMKPNQKNAARLRKVLNQLFGNSGNTPSPCC